MKMILRGLWCVAAAAATLVVANCSGGEETDGDSKLPVVEWGELPIPQSCQATSSSQEDDSCSLQVECGDARALAKCHGTGSAFTCECFDSKAVVTYRLNGVTLHQACPHAAAACLNWPDLDAEPYDCTLTDEVDEPDYCIADGRCTRDGVIGEAEFTEFHDRLSDCTAVGAGWSCGCGLPTGNRFKLANATSTQQCSDAFEWCALDGVELKGSRKCTLTDVSSDEERCTATTECESPVLLAGEEGTMYEDDVIACYRGESGHYECSCSLGAPYSAEVTADDPESACSAAVKKCDGG